MNRELPLKRGQIYEDPAGETWRITDVRRKEVSAEYLYEGEPTGLTARISRRELAGWERLTEQEEVG